MSLCLGADMAHRLPDALADFDSHWPLCEFVFLLSIRRRLLACTCIHTYYTGHGAKAASGQVEVEVTASDTLH